MSSVEAIRSEIERRIEKYNEYLDKAASERAAWKWAECKSLLSFIDSLQQEQPEVNLDEEIQMEWDSFNKHLAEYGGEQEDVVWLNWYSFDEIARHFFELGKNSK